MRNLPLLVLAMIITVSCATGYGYGTRGEYNWRYNPYYYEEYHYWGPIYWEWYGRWVWLPPFGRVWMPFVWEDWQPLPLRYVGMDRTLGLVMGIVRTLGYLLPVW